MKNKSPRAQVSAGAGVVHWHEHTGSNTTRPVIKANPTMTLRLAALLWRIGRAAQ